MFLCVILYIWLGCTQSVDRSNKAGHVAPRLNSTAVRGHPVRPAPGATAPGAPISEFEMKISSVMHAMKLAEVEYEQLVQEKTEI